MVLRLMFPNVLPQLHPSIVKEMNVYYLQLSFADMVTLPSSTAPRISLKYKKLGVLSFATVPTRT